MEPLLRSRLVTLTFDASDPMRAASFWSEALGWQIGEADADDVELEPDDATPFSLLFQRVPEPKVVQNRTHLDLTTSSLDDQRDTGLRMRLDDRGQVHVIPLDATARWHHPIRLTSSSDPA